MGRTGLVLEGGGLRAVYNAGTLDRFHELELKFDYVIGSSAGAANAASFISGQKGRNMRIIVNYLTSKKFYSFWNIFRGKPHLDLYYLYNDITYVLDPLDLEALKDLKLGTQKTVRWPGYAAKVTVLKEMGLLSHKPVEVDGVQVVPKRLLDAVLYPHVKLEEGERDITLFRVEAIGEKKGRPRRYKVEMVDRYDKASGFTAMARTTAFTGATIARMVARGEVKAKGMWMPEQVITGPLFDRLLDDLAAFNVRFDLTTEKTKALS